MASGSKNDLEAIFVSKPKSKRFPWGSRENWILGLYARMIAQSFERKGASWMARGRTLGDYKTDLNFLPAHVAVDVPNNLFAEASLKWVAAVAGSPRSPKRMTPRHGIGVDATGHRARVIIPDLTADLWTGVATTWTFIDNNGTTQTATLTGLVGEAATK